MKKGIIVGRSNANICNRVRLCPDAVVWTLCRGTRRLRRFGSTSRALQTCIHSHLPPAIKSLQKNICVIIFKTMRFAGRLSRKSKVSSPVDLSSTCSPRNVQSKITIYDCLSCCGSSEFMHRISPSGVRTSWEALY